MTNGARRGLVGTTCHLIPELLMQQTFKRRSPPPIVLALASVLSLAALAPASAQSSAGAQAAQNMRLRVQPIVGDTPTPPGFSAPLLVGSSKKLTPAAQGTRFVIRYRDRAVTAAGAASVSALSARVSAMSVRAGVNLTPLKVITGGSLVISAAKVMDAQEQRATALRIQASDPNILSVEPDAWVTPMGTIESYNDPYAPQQWTHRSRSLERGGANFEQAHKRSDGKKADGQGILVAVLDTGTTKHPDAQGASEVPGYDFVTDATYAGDGGGRDADPTDPGDFCATSGSSSSWHGTAVASQIGAIANNNSGIVGAAPGARLMHARVLGRCGGWLSDTVDAIYWLAGTPVTGAPAVSERPKVINMSLGSALACPSYLQQAVDAANAAGIVIVAAAGNNGANAIHTPANCQGVVAVGAHTQSGDLASYSNYDVGMTLTAPGGGSCKQQAGCQSAATLAAGTVGKTVFESHAAARYFNGTSAAAPQVAGAVALLLARAPSLTPAQVKTALQSSAAPHGADTFCATAGLCGVGLLDADALLSTVAAPVMSIDVVSGVSRTSTTEPTLAGLARKNSTVSFKVTNAGTNIVWKQLSGPRQTFTTATNGTSVQLNSGSVSGVVELELTATDSSGKSQRSVVSYRVNEPPTFGAVTLTPGKEGVAYPANAPLPARDSDADPLTYALSGTVPAGLSMNALGQLSWPSPVAGVYTLQVSVADPYGQVASGAMTLQIAKAEAPAVAPTVNGGLYSGRAGIAATLPVTIKASAGRTVTTKVTGMPAGMTFSGSALTWAKPAQGRWAVTVLAADSGGLTGQGVFTFDIKQANRAPVFAALAKATASTASAFTGKVVATDADGDAVTYSLQSGPSGFVVRPTGELSWPAPRVGTHSIVVRATDTYGAQASATLTLVVTAPNVAPVLPALPKLAPIAAGSSLTLTVKASDANNDPLTYSLVGAPAGMKISGGTITWQKIPAGTYRFTLVVKDPGGLSASGTIELSVYQPNRAPAFSTGAVKVSAKQGVAFTRVFKAVDPDNQALTYSLTGAPSDVSFDSKSGTLTWAKPVKGVYRAVVVARDSAGLAAQQSVTITVK